MSFTKMRIVTVGLGLLGLGLVGATAAEAKNCPRLCRKDISHYRQRVCTKYKGSLRAACRREVRKDILSWCKDEERTDICASILE
jgi:hypothetical protein